MNHSQHVASTAHWFGEHRLDSATASRHRNVDETPLIIALIFTVLVVAALIWCCFSPIARARAKGRGLSDRDPETAVANGPPLTHLGAGAGQNSRFLPSAYNRTRSATLPHAVYDPLQHRVSLANLGGSQRFDHIDFEGGQRERSRSLSSLPSLPCPLYRPDVESTLVEYDRCPPPAYSSPASPSDPISTPASAPPNRDMEVSGTHEITFSGPDSSLAAVPWKPAEWKDFPLSLSQPTITEISSALYRTLSSPGRYTANHNVSKLALYTPRNTFFYGTCTASVDQFGRMVIPRLLIPEQTTPSDSIATISPCAMVSTAEDTPHAEFVPSHSDNSSCKDPNDLNTVLAREYFSSDGGQEPKWTPIHEANQIGTNPMEISA